MSETLGRGSRRAAGRLTTLTLVAVAIAACGGDGGATTVPADIGAQTHPDVVAAQATRSPDGTWRFDVTISSPYDSDARYADAFRVRGPDGAEYGIRVLTHPHQNEQPFTRSLSGVEIPDDVDRVVIEGRDSVNAWGGATVEIALE